MKTSYLRKLCASVLALSAGCAFTADAGTLMYEDWSGIADGANAVSGGNWTMANGLAEQIVVDVNGGGYSGRFISPDVYGNETGGLQLLPTLQSADSYAYGAEGISITTQVALATGNDSSNYFRIGIRSASASNHNYWVDLYGTYARFQKQAGASSTVATLGENYYYVPGTTPINQLVDLVFSITPLEEGGAVLTLTLNGIEVLVREDGEGVMPSFANGLFVTIGMRSPREGYIGAIELQSIPEPGHVALLAGGGIALMAMRGAARRRRDGKVG